MSKYKSERPKETHTDRLSSSEIEKLLEGYSLVTDLSRVAIGTHVRYYKKVEGKNKRVFRMGGTLKNAGGLPDYVVLSNGRISWSAQVEGAKFYEKLGRERLIASHETEKNSGKELIASYEAKMWKLVTKNERLAAKNKELRERLRRLLSAPQRRATK